MDDSTDTEPLSPERGSSLWPLALLMLLAAAYLLVVQWRRAVRPQAGLGQPVPPLTVAGWINTDHPPTTDDLRGQVVLIDCWASWCRPCIANMPELIDLYARYHDQGLIVIGLTPERGGELARVQAYVAHTDGLDWPIAYGAELPIEMMGVDAFPNYTLFDRSGRSVWSDFRFRGLEDAVVAALAQPQPQPQPAAGDAAEPAPTAQ